MINCLLVQSAAVKTAVKTAVNTSVKQTVSVVTKMKAAVTAETPCTLMAELCDLATIITTTD